MLQESQSAKNKKISNCKNCNAKELAKFYVCSLSFIFMTYTDKQELHSLKTVLTTLKTEKSTTLSHTLSELNLSLSYESILIYRHLNELFLCVNTYNSIDTDDFKYIKNKLLHQIDSVIDKN